MKKLLSVVAAALVALTFVGCDGLLQKDDTEGAIKGAGKNYTVDYKNESENAYRAYNATSLKHSGGLIKVTFDSTDIGTSKMGVIFDLKNTKDSDGKDIKGTVDFYCIGLNPKSDIANFYVSKFTNVTDLQAYNFGTDLTENPAKEVEVVQLAKTNNITYPAPDEDGKVSVYVYFKANTDGSFDYKILNISEDVAAKFDVKTSTFESSAIIKEGNIPATVTGYEPCEAGKEPQNKLAVYAQIAAGFSLKGSWNFIGTYLEAEDAE